MGKHPFQTWISWACSTNQVWSVCWTLLILTWQWASIAFTLVGLQQAFRPFGPVQVEWPGKDSKQNSQIPKGKYFSWEILLSFSILLLFTLPILNIDLTTQRCIYVDVEASLIFEKDEIEILLSKCWSTALFKPLKALFISKNLEDDNKLFYDLFPCNKNWKAAKNIMNNALLSAVSKSNWHQRPCFTFRVYHKANLKYFRRNNITYLKIDTSDILIIQKRSKNTSIFQWSLQRDQKIIFSC